MEGIISGCVSRYFLRLRSSTSNDNTPVWSRTPTMETFLFTLYSN